MSANQPSRDDDVVFFTIASEPYFLGVVALVNSIRQMGYRSRIVVLDCGLSPDQLAALAGHCETVKPPAEASSPTLYKGFGHAMNPSGVSVIIDSDAILSRRIDGIIAKAREGQLCLTVDPEADRWFAEWQDIFGLAAPLRREAYVNSGFMVLSTAHWPNLLQRWWELCERLFASRVHYQDATGTDPIAQSDQDALNALIMGELPPDRIERLPAGTLVHCAFERAVLLDAQTLETVTGEGPASILHWPGQPKPWLWRDVPAFRQLARYSLSNPYVILLRRLLTGDDVAIRLADAMMPLRLRPGFRGAAAFNVLGAIGEVAVPVSARLRAMR